MKAMSIHTEENQDPFFFKLVGPKHFMKSFSERLAGCISNTQQWFNSPQANLTSVTYIPTKVSWLLPGLAFPDDLPQTSIP